MYSCKISRSSAEFLLVLLIEFGTRLNTVCQTSLKKKRKCLLFCKYFRYFMKKCSMQSSVSGNSKFCFPFKHLLLSHIYNNINSDYFHTKSKNNLMSKKVVLSLIFHEENRNSCYPFINYLKT